MDSQNNGNLDQTTCENFDLGHVGVGRGADNTGGEGSNPQHHLDHLGDEKQERFQLLRGEQDYLHGVEEEADGAQNENSNVFTVDVYYQYGISSSGSLQFR